MSTGLMTSIGKHTPHLVVLDPGIPIYNWRGNERASCSYYCYRGNSHSIENCGPTNSHATCAIFWRDDGTNIIWYQVVQILVLLVDRY
eukprot:COSAG02_NODE_11_length_58539_cov_103.119473_29_plen_88_part_00